MEAAFISRLAAEDRCHLNGVALLEAVPNTPPASRRATSLTAGATTARTAVSWSTSTAAKSCVRVFDAAFAALA